MEAMSTLRLHIDGPKGGIGFDSFVRLLQESLLVLRDADSAVSGRATGVLEWVVIDLASAHGLDAVIESRPRLAGVDAHMASMIASSYVDALNVAEAGDVLPPHLSDLGLTHLENLAGRLRRNGAEALRTTYVEMDQAATVSVTTAENVKRLRVPRSRAIGSIVGKLEVVSVHRRPEYSVYDSVTRRPVRCAFSENELEQVKATLGRRVRVSGLVHRNAKGQPLRIEQPRLSVMPGEPELPTVSDLIGVAPDFTGNLTTEEHLRQLRDA